ncbi:Sucrose synthase 6 [Raphanus sativus]|nr:Sucrose synthase 6 [Raphanus sativus]KAJ4875492.1 Sucrose synthase 6 [Raphanus sativus]
MLYNLEFKHCLLPKKPTSLGGGSRQTEVTKTQPKSRGDQEQNEVKEGLLAAEASERMKVLKTSEATQRLEKMKIAYRQQRNQGASPIRNLFWSVVVSLYICSTLKQRFFGTYSVQNDQELKQKAVNS